MADLPTVSYTYLARHVGEIEDRILASDKPMILTHYGKPRFALLKVADYDRLREVEAKWMREIGQAWRRLEPIEGQMRGCLHAGHAEDVLAPDFVVSEVSAHGGSAKVTRDSEVVWSAPSVQDDQEDPDEGGRTVADIEAQAAADPDHDWRIVFDSYLWDATYQRQDGRWVLVLQGLGFA